MPNRYRIRVIETVHYIVDVEAEDQDAARDLAEALVTGTRDRDKWCMEVSERESILIFEDPPNWENDVPEGFHVEDAES